MKCKKCNKKIDEETEIKSVQEDTILGGIMIVGYECSECGYKEDI